jgi:hypothetical protein
MLSTRMWLFLPVRTAFITENPSVAAIEQGMAKNNSKIICIFFEETASFYTKSSTWEHPSTGLCKCILQL